MIFRIAQISDTHPSAGKPFFVENFVRVAQAIAADVPDLLLNTGDILLGGATFEADLVAARRLHDGLDLPVRFVPGNHDNGDNQDVRGVHSHTIKCQPAPTLSPLLQKRLVVFGRPRPGLVDSQRPASRPRS